ncbi:efflux RND transporter periplasmic adaptor subunit [Rhizobium sp. BK456]|uniref:efflux RND transporter periplasmic adaptor subunit n=1 Tax=Rhizobium sp. BK456 TaxID=2587007 RepID=UPI00160974BB|nr:efflux RND transporter periplasmic adaptor subunit [Rhizobium sp. BK456]MBB3524870.1 RND family efflux transporter MFP subunit [Rhizobium sp. BK456]
MFEVAISVGSAMFAGMNTTSEHDRDLAAKLRSLSIEPGTLKMAPPKPRARRRVIPGAMLVLAAAAPLAAALFYRAETLQRVETALAGFSGGDLAISADRVERRVRDGVAVEAMRTPTEDEAKSTAASTREITGSGYVVATDIATVFSKYEGRIVAVEVDAGDSVVAGQVLVRLDDAGAGFSLRGAEISGRAAALALDARTIESAQARLSFARSERLAGRDAMSAQSLEEARTAVDKAENAVLQARQDAEKAELEIDKARERVEALMVRAPISGIVTRLDAHVGDTVLSREDSVREDESLLTITDTASLVIDADVAEANIALMRPGLSGEAILDGFPGQPFAIEVSKIAPVISREKGTVTLRLSLTSPPLGMRPAMAARIRLVVGDAAASGASAAGAHHPPSSFEAPAFGLRTSG